MKTKELDIVYTIKDSPDNEELRYSLRSLRNFPHRKVFIYGGLPSCVNPESVTFVKVSQDYNDKWMNTASLLIRIAEDENITEDFVWFNDDFFVMKKMSELDYFYDRKLNDRIRDFEKRSFLSSRGKYAQRLRRAEWALKAEQKPTLNFEIHTPMIFNRRKLLDIIKQFPGYGAKRSLYGNCYVDNAIQRDDIKIFKYDQKPTGEEDFLSTTDGTFRKGEVGKFIRSKFRARSPYELNNKKEAK